MFSSLKLMRGLRLSLAFQLFGCESHVLRPAFEL